MARATTIILGTTATGIHGPIPGGSTCTTIHGTDGASVLPGATIGSIPAGTTMVITGHIPGAGGDHMPTVPRWPLGMATATMTTATMAPATMDIGLRWPPEAKVLAA